MAPSEGPARSRGPGEEGGVFRRAGGGFCGERRGTRSERRREKKREGTQEEETAHGMGEESGRVERKCGRVVQGTGDCKINARVGVSATTRPSVSCRRVRAFPATTRAPRTPDLNVASKRGLERCKIDARFCGGRRRPSLRSTLTSGGRGGKPSADRWRPAPPPPGCYTPGVLRGRGATGAGCYAPGVLRAAGATRHGSYLGGVLRGRGTTRERMSSYMMLATFLILGSFMILGSYMML